jgi:photosystem II stability/assembly factor-like uncharacterized protein
MKNIIYGFFVLFFFVSSFVNAQWILQNSGTTNALYDIEFINDKTGWCCGDGIIIKTTNGGVNWIQQTNGVLFETYFGIHPVDSNIVYAVGFFRTFIKTTNGGVSWFTLDSGGAGTGSYMCVYFINKNTGWIGNWESPDFGVKKTTDGGATLTLYSYLDFPKDLFFKDSLNGIGVQNMGLIHKTTNGGINWQINQLAGSGDFYRVSFIDNYTGYTSSTRAVYKTTNFGVSWDSVGRITPLNIDVTSIEFCNDNTGWAGTQHQMYKTINGGKDWVIQNSTLIGVVYSIWSFNDRLVWGCGNGGRIWHTTNGGDTIVNINKITSNVPSGFSLYQNYPNPFNNSTVIKFDIRDIGKYSLVIYDVLGRKQEELFNEYLTAGSYNVTFNADGLSSGVYFYRLYSDKTFITKKFLIIK